MTTFKEYRNEINKIFARYIHHGFVDYYSCRRLSGEMINLVVEATKELSFRGEYKELFDLVNKGFLKWSKTDKDDSDGETQDFTYFVNKAWDVIYEANNSNISHKKMYEWFEKHLDGSLIDYMEDSVYEYITHHFTELDLLKRKFSFFNNKIVEARKDKKDNYHEFLITRCQENLLFVMADMKKPITEIRKYALSIKSSSVKETMAKIEYLYGNMDEVIAIYEDLAAEEENSGYPLENWHLKLMEVYKKLGDSDKYKKELRAALKINVGDKELWEDYKSYYSKEEWSRESEEIFSEIEPGDYNAYSWYEIEKRYDLMMAALENTFFSDKLKFYEGKLKLLYPERCITLLIKDTENMASQANNRKAYKRVVKNLAWIKKYPEGDKKAEELADKFRSIYKQKSAFMEEISKFKSLLYKSK